MIALAFLLYLFSVRVMGGVALAILDMGDEI